MSETVRIKFTGKQFEVFSEACKTAAILFGDDEFVKLFRKRFRLGNFSDKDIEKLLVEPLRLAPERVIPKRASSKISGFTFPHDMTEESALLYRKISEVLAEEEMERLIEKLPNIKEENGKVSTTEVRVMLCAYLRLKKDDERKHIFDEGFLTDIAPISYNKFFNNEPNRFPTNASNEILGLHHNQ